MTLRMRIKRADAAGRLPPTRAARPEPCRTPPAAGKRCVHVASTEAAQQTPELAGDYEASLRQLLAAVPRLAREREADSRPEGDQVGARGRLRPLTSNGGWPPSGRLPVSWGGRPPGAPAPWLLGLCPHEPGRR